MRLAVHHVILNRLELLMGHLNVLKWWHPRNDALKHRTKLSTTHFTVTNYGATIPAVAVGCNISGWNTWCCARETKQKYVDREAQFDHISADTDITRIFIPVRVWCMYKYCSCWVAHMLPASGNGIKTVATRHNSNNVAGKLLTPIIARFGLLDQIFTIIVVTFSPSFSLHSSLWCHYNDYKTSPRRFVL